MGNAVEVNPSRASNTRGTHAEESPQLDPGGRAAAGQASEIIAARNARQAVLRGLSGTNLDAETLATGGLPDLAVIARDTRFFAQAKGDAGVLVDWATQWDQHQPDIAHVAGAYRQLDAMARSGVDWRHPDAHQADFEGAPGRTGLREYSGGGIEGAKADLVAVPDEAALDAQGKQIATDVEVATLHLRKAKNAVLAGLATRRMVLTGEAAEVNRKQGAFVGQLVDAAVVGAELGLKLASKGLLKAPKVGRRAEHSAELVGLAKDLELGEIVAKLMTASEQRRLRDGISELRDQAWDAEFDGWLAGIAAAEATLRQARRAQVEHVRQLRRVRAQRAHRQAALGQAIDDRRVETGDSPQRGPAWASLLTSVSGRVEALDLKLSECIAFLAQDAGPRLVVDLTDALGEQMSKPGAGLNPSYAKPHENDVSMAEAAGAHIWLSRELPRLQETVVKPALTGWRILMGALETPR